ncbi:hypothetical protein D3C75_467700 [compost metagenome]
MKDPCTIFRRGPEAHAEYLVVILILYEKQPGAALQMFHREYGGIDLPDKFLINDLKSIIYVACDQAAHRFASSALDVITLSEAYHIPGRLFH